METKQTTDQEQFFRNVLSEVQSLRSYAKHLHIQADSVDEIADNLETSVQTESEKLGIDPFEVKEF